MDATARPSRGCARDAPGPSSRAPAPRGSPGRCSAGRAAPRPAGRSSAPCRARSGSAGPGSRSLRVGLLAGGVRARVGIVARVRAAPGTGRAAPPGRSHHIGGSAPGAPPRPTDPRRSIARSTSYTEGRTSPPRPPAGRHEIAMKIGRNAPCPCGSGKKYKKCCLSREGAPRRPEAA
ncbi:MAG: SEC-C domain-containing protein, partial [Dehalococcoidia bacterium]|nr:SEC-C domain-containing protein [Dehalococcoidia bacterium]